MCGKLKASAAFGRRKHRDTKVTLQKEDWSFVAKASLVFYRYLTNQINSVKWPMQLQTNRETKQNFGLGDYGIYYSIGKGISLKLECTSRKFLTGVTPTNTELFWSKIRLYFPKLHNVKNSILFALDVMTREE